MFRVAVRRFLSSASTPPPSSTFPPHELIRFPRITSSSLVGGIDKWRKKEGEPIAKGEVLVEITPYGNNTIMNCECQNEAVFAKKLVSEKARLLKEGTVIAVVVKDPKDVSAFENTSFYDFNPPETYQGVLATDSAFRYAAKKQLDLKKIKGNGPYGLITFKNVKKFYTHGENWETKPYFQDKE